MSFLFILRNNKLQYQIFFQSSVSIQFVTFSLTHEYQMTGSVSHSLPPPDVLNVFLPDSLHNVLHIVKSGRAFPCKSSSLNQFSSYMTCSSFCSFPCRHSYCALRMFPLSVPNLPKLLCRSFVCRAAAAAAANNACVPPDSEHVQVLFRFESKLPHPVHSRFIHCYVNFQVFRKFATFQQHYRSFC